MGKCYRRGGATYTSSGCFICKGCGTHKIVDVTTHGAYSRGAWRDSPNCKRCGGDMVWYARPKTVKCKNCKSYIKILTDSTNKTCNYCMKYEVGLEVAQ